MTKFLKNFFNKVVLHEKSATKLALSFCIGVFLAFLPIIPFQTPLGFLLTWLLHLNITVVMAVLYTINNPITMIPIYMIAYFFGTWVMGDLFNLKIEQYNPLWATKFSNFISKYINLKKYLGTTQICVPCLLVGGFLLSAIISIAIYPMMKQIFSRFIEKLDKIQANENNSAK